MTYVWKIASLIGSAIFAVAIVGCGAKEDRKVSDNAADAMPTFTLATSEYPSWSTFMVARKAGLIGKEGGEPGSLEKKWGVRIKLEVKDYDPCITMFGAGTVDAVAITNIDVLNPAMGRACTAILPTSTSVGGDKVIGMGVNNLKDLKGKKVYGLAKSVSEFVFVRGLEKQGENPKDYQFANLEPAAAATALQSGAGDVKVACIWNPYALQTLRTNKNSKVIFDSSAIPEEVIDMVVMGNDSLKKEGGDKFACLLCDIFYNVCMKMDDPKSSDATYKALGEDFSNLPVDDMKLCCKDTRFYTTPQSGMKLFMNENFQNKTMPTVIKTCQTISILEADKKPTIGYGDNSKQLNFETKYMQKVASDK